MYLASPITAIAIQRWPNTRRPAMFIGFVIMVVSLMAASFCETATGLLATQGVLYGLGGLIMYFPGMAFVDEWFVARKGIAFGIMWAGTGMAGAVVPFILQWLLDQYGYKSTLRIWAVVTVSSPTHNASF
jgi:MFS family permease